MLNKGEFVMLKMIVVNVGSLIVKFKLFDMLSEEVVVEGNIEWIGMDMGYVKIKYGDG